MNSFPISLVIPVFNEGASITELIDSIRAQHFQPAEVIFVDGGSTDDTVTLTKQLIAADLRFQIVEAGRAMPGKGRNIGAAHAKNEWIAFTDAGIKLDNYWLEELGKTANANPEAAIIYGNYSPFINTFFEKCATIAYVSPEIQGQIRGEFIASSMFRKEVWEKAGGFPDWRAAEDLIFMEKAGQLGYKVAFAPDAMVYWKLRENISSTYKRFDLYSKYNVWAGRQAYWHYGVAKQYAIVAVFLLLGVFHHWLWFLAIPLWLMARVTKRILLHRNAFGVKTLFNPALFLLVMLLTIVIDIATFSGWIKALLNLSSFKQVSSQ